MKNSIEPIGNLVADRPVDKKINSIELSFILHPNYWENGYIKEATIEVLHHLFQIRFAYILYGYEEGNKKSRRVVEKIGFKEHSTKQNSWSTNGLPITTYTCILSKKELYDLYKENFIHK